MNLKTIPGYAQLVGVGRSTISERVKAGSMEVTLIDGVQFIDLDKYPVASFQKTKEGRPKTKVVKGSKKVK